MYPAIRGSIVACAVAAAFSCAPVARAEEKILARFEAFPQAAVSCPLIIDDVNAMGRVKAHGLQAVGVGKLAPGDYLGFLGDAKLLASPYFLRAGVAMFRASVSEVSADKKVTFDVGAKVAAQLKAGAVILLATAPTKEDALQAIPEFVILECSEDFPPVDRSVARNQSNRNLRELGIALNNFQAAWGHLPPTMLIGPDGRAWHSWRAILLPYLDVQGPLENYRFTEPWDSPHNAALLKEMPKVYSDPIYGENKNHYTHFAAVVGNGAGWEAAGVKFDGKRPDNWKTLAGSRFAQVTDGLSNTVAIGPVSPELKIPWLKPEDVTLSAEKLPAFSYPYRYDRCSLGPFLFFDGAVQMLASDLKADTLRSILTRGGDEIVRIDEVVGRIPKPQRPHVPDIVVVRDGDEVKARVEYTYR